VVFALVVSACTAGTTNTSFKKGSPEFATGGVLTAAQRKSVSKGADPARTDTEGIEWLCNPDLQVDPCRFDSDATSVPAKGVATVQRSIAVPAPPIDCFYVYPTTSTQLGLLSNLHIDPVQTVTAELQASRFSQACRVFAPMYQQVTQQVVDNVSELSESILDKAYQGVASGWDDYMAHYNHGRGVVLIGDSQGATMLTALIRAKVDPYRQVRRQLVSAILLGGNVTVPVGRDVGGSFENIPACTSLTQTGCVVAFSSFEQPPPTDSIFGRPGQGVSLFVPHASRSAAGLEVLCVNPSSISGGTGVLDPYFLSPSGAMPPGSTRPAGQPATPWLRYPDLYSAHCEYQDGASWLQVSAPITPGDTRPVVTQSLGPQWGLHLYEMNLALGNLVELVLGQARSYAR
jgi:hypothetical protein